MLSLLVFHPDLWKMAHEEFLLQKNEWQEPDLSALYERLFIGYPLDQSFSATTEISSGQAIRPPAGLTPDETTLFNSLASFAEQEFSAQELSVLRQELISSLVYMRRARTQRDRHQLEEDMREAERLGDSARISELLQRFNELK